MRTRVSIIIKALNEEHIRASIESALEALAGIGGEVILADRSLDKPDDRDRSRVPDQDRAAREREGSLRRDRPRLAYPHARGEYICILDGDMVLDGRFLCAAVGELDRDSTLAGVAGLVTELAGGNYEFELRRRSPLSAVPGEQPWLVCGGLYRREALAALDYVSNRNLHGYEEQELGLRLGEKGWRMVRLPMEGVRHFGHRSALELSGGAGGATTRTHPASSCAHRRQAVLPGRPRAYRHLYDPPPGGSAGRRDRPPRRDPSPPLFRRRPPRLPHAALA
jgi:hypothetical protein